MKPQRFTQKSQRLKQQGLSLIELMVSITLGLILSLALIQAYLSTRTVYRVQDSVSRMQESARYAMTVLEDDIRMAGFMGCPSIDRIPVNIIASNVSDYKFTPDTVIVGSDNVTAANAWEAVAGTDVLTIRKATDGSARLTGNTDPNNANIQIAREAGTPEFEKNQVLMVTDCTSADVFRATSVSGGQDKITMAHASATNITNKLSKSYGTDAEVLLFETIDYFIKDTKRTTPSGKPIYALWVRRLNTVNDDGSVPTTTPYEIVDGVEDMQLRFGVDSAGNDRTVDEYKTAAAVTAANQWSKVVSVRVNLLMQGNDDNAVGTTGEQVQTTFKFDGKDVTKQDGILRQVFSSAVAVRNRVP